MYGHWWHRLCYICVRPWKSVLSVSVDGIHPFCLNDLSERGVARHQQRCIGVFVEGIQNGCRERATIMHDVPMTMESVFEKLVICNGISKRDDDDFDSSAEGVGGLAETVYNHISVGGVAYEDCHGIASESVGAQAKSSAAVEQIKNFAGAGLLGGRRCSRGEGEGVSTQSDCLAAAGGDDLACSGVNEDEMGNTVYVI
jgi:hypothetical protein